LVWTKEKKNFGPHRDHIGILTPNRKAYGSVHNLIGQLILCIFVDGSQQTSKTMLCAELNTLIVCAYTTYDGILTS